MVLLVFETFIKKCSKDFKLTDLHLLGKERGREEGEREEME